MDNKKNLNTVLIILSALTVITFAVFYKNLAQIELGSTALKIIFWGFSYLSIVCLGIGLIINLACAFRDEFDIVWFVQFLDLCGFSLILITSLILAIADNCKINFVFFFLVLEFALINLIPVIYSTISNFKYLKKDFKSVFSNGDPDKSYRYGLEKEEDLENPSSKIDKTKAEKYSLLDEINDDEIPSIETLVNEEDITTTQEINEETQIETSKVEDNKNTITEKEIDKKTKSQKNNKKRNKLNDLNTENTSNKSEQDSIIENQNSATENQNSTTENQNTIIDNENLNDNQNNSKESIDSEKKLEETLTER